MSASDEETALLRLRRRAHDAAAVAVGLTILGINRVQLTRRELQARLEAARDRARPAGE